MESAHTLSHKQKVASGSTGQATCHHLERGIFSNSSEPHFPQLIAMSNSRGSCGEQGRDSISEMRQVPYLYGTNTVIEEHGQATFIYERLNSVKRISPSAFSSISMTNVPSYPALKLTLRVSAWISVHSNAAVTRSHLILSLNTALPGFNTYRPLQASHLRVDSGAGLPRAPLDKRWWAAGGNVCSS